MKHEQLGLPLDPSARANIEQTAASNPAASVFVSANAGSGKTKLLVDRLLRLLLTGAEPSRIQCLTFTKAAAAEMAIRLNTQLGRWVTLADAALDAALLALQFRPDAALRTKARALFAEVLDLPGGMRIGTIHAFCESLLRRFPIEASLSPHFRLVEESESRVALEGTRETILAQASTQAITALAGLVKADEFGDLVVELERRRELLANLLALPEPAMRMAVRRAAGARDTDLAGLMHRATEFFSLGRLREAARTMAERGAPGTQKTAARMLTWLAMSPERRVECWEDWVEVFFAKNGEPLAPKSLCNPNLAKTEPELLELLLAEQARIAGIEEARAALLLADATIGLIDLAAPVLRAFAEHKSAAQLLDFEDLIGRSQALLREPGAAWVLFKLDGGLDHLLLDEVQDSAPAQWAIAGALTGEFFAGAGAHDDTADGLGRTIFAVGDRKQSIYSFQGAEPAAFDRWREVFREQVEGAKHLWRDIELDVSFRSTSPVLELVDTVFADPDAAQGVGRTKHVAHRQDAHGQVTLWPLAPRPDRAERIPYHVPDDNQGQDTAPQRLAERLAVHIRDEIAAGTWVPSRGRPMQAGDVLVLVRRRGDFQRALVRALKAQGVEVAGLDRMMLTDQPAVQDLISLGETLLLPEDDLTLACVLTSPLGGLTDDELMALAAGRSGRLSEALADRADERSSFRAAADFLAALRRRVDFVSPHALLSEALGPLGGRARLFARLGPEAAEPVDELLGAALDYAASHPPSLQGFLHWLRRSAAEVKREAEGAGQAVRVMTVHGAKGLQAPLVILPDTTALPREGGSLNWTCDPADSALRLPLWAPNKAFHAPALKRLREAARQRDREEYNRLLYVALTRAEDRLLVCGWETKARHEGSWYELVKRGMQALGAAGEPFEVFGGEALTHCNGPGTQRRETRPARAARAPPLPAWLGQAPDWRPKPPPTEPDRPLPLAPSRPDGVELGPLPEVASPVGSAGVDRFLRGRVVHALLEHLPALPPAERLDAGVSFATARGLPLPDAQTVTRQITRLIADPEHAALFGPGSRAEQPLAGLVGNRVVSGQVDRLVVSQAEVVVADFKSGRAPPADVDDTPAVYLRQMAAYRALLRLIYPDRPVRCLLIWTEAPLVQELPARLLDSHAPVA